MKKVAMFLAFAFAFAPVTRADDEPASPSVSFGAIVATPGANFGGSFVRAKIASCESADASDLVYLLDLGDGIGPIEGEYDSTDNEATFNVPSARAQAWNIYSARVFAKAGDVEIGSASTELVQGKVTNDVAFVRGWIREYAREGEYDRENEWTRTYDGVPDDTVVKPGLVDGRLVFVDGDKYCFHPTNEHSRTEAKVTVRTDMSFDAPNNDYDEVDGIAAYKVVSVVSGDETNLFFAVWDSAAGEFVTTELPAELDHLYSVTTVIDYEHGKITYSFPDVGSAQVNLSPSANHYVSGVRFEGIGKLDELFGDYDPRLVDANLIRDARGIEYASLDDAVANGKRRLEVLWPDLDGIPNGWARVQENDRYYLDPIAVKAKVVSTTPGVDFTNTTVTVEVSLPAGKTVSGLDNVVAQVVYTDEFDQKHVVGTGDISWNSPETDGSRTGTVTITGADGAPIIVDPMRGYDIVIVDDKGTDDDDEDDEVIGQISKQAISVIPNDGWISEYPNTEEAGTVHVNHGNTGTWTTEAVWGDDGVQVSNSKFTAKVPSQGNVVEIQSEMVFGEALDTSSLDTTGKKAGVVLVRDPGWDDADASTHRYRLAVLNNGSNWTVLDRNLVEPTTDGKYTVRVVLNYLAKQVSYTLVDDDDGDIDLGTYDNSAAMTDYKADPVRGAGYDGSGLVGYLYGKYLHSNVARDEDGVEYSTIAEGKDKPLTLIHDATFTPEANHEHLVLDVGGKRFYPAADWLWTYDDTTKLYRFNPGYEALVTYEGGATNVVFLDDAIATAVTGDDVKVLMGVTNEYAFAQAEKADITLNLNGQEISHPTADAYGDSLVAKGVISIVDEADASAAAPGRVYGELKLADEDANFQIYGGWFDYEFPETYIPAHYVRKVAVEGEWWTVSALGRFLKVDTDGTDEIVNIMPIFIPEEWIAENFPDDASDTSKVSDEAIVTKLNGVDANNLRTWQNYVLGIPTDGSLKLTGAADDTAGAKVAITARTVADRIAQAAAETDAVTLPDADIRFMFQFQYRNPASESGEWTDYGDPVATPTINIDLTDDKISTATYWRIKVIFSEIKK